MSSESGRRRRYWLGGKREAAQDQFFVEALDPALWEPGDEHDWDTCWYTGMPAPSVFDQLAPGRTVNHIPGNNALTVKSLLYRTLRDARARWEAQSGIAEAGAGRLAFFPRTFVMPHDYHALQHEAARRPEQRWILKPKNAARGRDIQVLDDVARVPVGERWMVQEYVGNPHTLEGCKYALRLYALITSVEPLRVYLYREGSAKLASEPYEPDNIGNVFAHLTNPDVNARNAASAAPVRFLPLADYRERLRAQGHDDAALFARLHDLVTLVAIAAREAMRRRCQRVKADTRGCYELLGLDCLIDEDLNPWLMECNLSPSLDICAAPQDGGVYETRTKRQMVADLVAMLGLNDPEPAPAPVAASPDPEAELVRRDQAELARAGDFQRLYPTAEAARYLPCFPLPRLADVALADALAGAPVARPRVTPIGVSELISEGGLALYGEATGTLYRPNPTAAWIWLQATDGKDPDTVARELAAATGEAVDGEAPWSVRESVWTALADWAADGLLWQGEAGAPALLPPEPPPATAPVTLTVAAGARRIALREVPAPVAARLEPALAPLIATGGETPAVTLRVVETASGYAVSEDGVAQAEGLTLAEVVPTLCRLLLVRASGAEEALTVDTPLVMLEAAGAQPPAAMLVVGSGAAADEVARALAARIGLGAGRGLVWLPASGETRGVGLPLRAWADAPVGAAGRSLHRHQWSRQGAGLLHAADAAAIGPCTVAGVVLAGDEPGGDPGALLAPLLPGCRASRGGRLRRQDLDALAAWLRPLPLHAVGPADEAALDRLARALAAAPETAELPG